MARIAFRIPNPIAERRTAVSSAQLALSGIGTNLRPGKRLEEFLAERHLCRAGQLHRVVPRDHAVVAAVRRFAVRIAAAVDLPNAVRPVSVAGARRWSCKPEHRAGPARRQRIAEHFVAGFAVDDRHRRLGGVRLRASPERRRHGLAPGRAAFAACRNPTARDRRWRGGTCIVDGRGMHRQRPPPRIGRADRIAAPRSSHALARDRRTGNPLAR